MKNWYKQYIDNSEYFKCAFCKNWIEFTEKYISNNLAGVQVGECSKLKDRMSTGDHICDIPSKFEHI